MSATPAEIKWADQAEIERNLPRKASLEAELAELDRQREELLRTLRPLSRLWKVANGHALERNDREGDGTIQRNVKTGQPISHLFRGYIHITSLWSFVDKRWLNQSADVARHEGRWAVVGGTGEESKYYDYTDIVWFDSEEAAIEAAVEFATTRTITDPEGRQHFTCNWM